MSTIYIAMVDQTETTFMPEMERNDVSMLELTINHDESQIPTADIVIKNPRIGLLNSSRFTWAWISWLPDDESPGGAIPLFFGVLVGIPSDMFKEVITLQYVAKSVNYIALKQAVAEGLKVAPNYMPEFIDDAHRDDPDAILEGYSSLYHIDRFGNVSTSDILTGEDGTLTFGSAIANPGRLPAFYDSVSLERDQSPLANIQVKMSVHWTQRTIGYVDGPDVNITSYTGGSFLEQWPKSGTSLGGGWKVESSYVTDVYLVSITPTMSLSSSVQFDENGTPTSQNTPEHFANDPLVSGVLAGIGGGFSYSGGMFGNSDCTVESVSSSISGPALLGPAAVSETNNLANSLYSPNFSGQIPPSLTSGGLPIRLTNVGTIGLCDPYADPPVNQPSSYHMTGLIVPQWNLNCTWNLRYDAKRDFFENLTFNLIANTQSVLGAPTVEQDTEVITINGADVGQPVITLDAWTDFAGQHVSVGQLIFPNNPTTPGGLSYQVCIIAGTAGTTEPVFSDTVGTVTIDGTVHWASLGTSPLTTQPDWSEATFVPAGQIICYQPVSFNSANGSFEKTGASYYLLCTTAGETNSQESILTYTPPKTDNIQAVPSQQEVTYIPGPSTTTFAESGNGSVVWTYLGSAPSFLNIPIGGTPDNVTARCYFPSDRGQLAIQYGICRARARHRMRARAIKIGWECRWQDIVNLSCRKNATLYDERLPGGVATGKVIAYSLKASKGRLIGHVEIGVAVGLGGTVTAVNGTGVYAQSGYVQSGYQQMTGGTELIGNLSDIGYTPPVFVPYDDGLAFPLSVLPGTSPANQTVNSLYPPTGDAQTISGDLTSQANAIMAGAAASQALAKWGTVGGWGDALAQIALSGSTVQYYMEANPIIYDIDIGPVTNGPFTGAYTVTCTQLQIPMGINLAAPSN